MFSITLFSSSVNDNCILGYLPFASVELLWKITDFVLLGSAAEIELTDSTETPA